MAFDGDFEFDAVSQPISIRCEAFVTTECRYAQHLATETGPLAIVLDGDGHCAVCARIFSVGHNHVMTHSRPRGNASHTFPHINCWCDPLRKTFQHGNINPLAASCP